MTTRTAPADHASLKKFSWYLPHQAWLKQQGLPHHYPGGAAPVRASLPRSGLQHAVLPGAHLSGANLTRVSLAGADLFGAVLVEADLTCANLNDSDLRHANLRNADLDRATLRRARLDNADLTGADLEGADLTDTTLFGTLFSPPDPPKTYAEAIQRVKSWLTKDRWLQKSWIKTPDGCYAGSCKACLHGAAVYMGGKFGQEICERLDGAGYDVEWNDQTGRTYEEVMEALGEVSP